MQREINVSQYLKIMARTVEEYCRDENDEILKGCIQAQAYIFFEVFGLEISTNLVDAYDNSYKEKEYDEKYYKSLFLLCKYMKNEDVTVFINVLRSCCYSLDEEVSN